ncbi:LysR family transcriptional regulator (plasmid) [Dinoroseobacter shibae]|uniref:LysR family transcriptional regulator n=1 Tax=Dinoroseobacter shibae TaxID=215813 RepID=UPI001FDFAC77|nr:LysR family transcriptional regulator [Dinoroseobacter shibae]URF49150.1 LysR family transcriptional regulator [Dinoroseobacter shibae]URF53458.1 LysR family transcriptional regulator [Dinoroseobacter shibae]
MQTLVAVADTGSFAAAAGVVNLTPSAISQQIQSLEAEIGAQLFDRKKRPRQLNAQGEELVRAARSVVQTLTEARMTIAGGRTAGVLKLGAIRTVSMRLVPEALRGMRGRYPDLGFEMTVGMSERLMADVAAGRLDAALVAEHVGVPATLSWSPVLNEPLVIIAPPQEAWRSEVSLLRDLPFIRYATDVPLARQIETELSGLSIVPREVAVANTMPAVVGLVQAGLGVAVVPRIATLHGGPALHCRPFRDGAITRRVGLVQRQVSSRSRVLTELREILSEVALHRGLVLDPTPGRPGAA